METSNNQAVVVYQENHFWSLGLLAVIVSQFLSALADNALLFAAIAALRALNAPDWQIPLLQEFFVIGFILFAPFVGLIADKFPKGRVLLGANIVKLLGSLGMVFGLGPIFCYGIVGIGAAAYSPAKYGILGQLVKEDQLVKANGIMEGSTIVAILLGAMFGGFFADDSPSVALGAVLICYILAIIGNFFIPKLSAISPHQSLSIRPAVKEFLHSLVSLFRNGNARFSMLGTGIFWGAGSTLRFLLVAWVPLALNIENNKTPALLNAVVAIGIAAGAFFAAKFITLKNVYKAIPAGFCIGLAVVCFAYTTNVYIAVLLLVILGALGGFFVVPLNAMLQDEGIKTIGAGHAVAVQNLTENTLMLLMVGLYTLMLKVGVEIIPAAVLFGCLISFGILSISMMKYFSSIKIE